MFMQIGFVLDEGEENEVARNFKKNINFTLQLQFFNTFFLFYQPALADG